MTIFDSLISDFTGGIIKDVEAAVVAGLALSFLVLAIDILAVRFFNISVSASLSRYREEQDYKEYARHRALREKFDRQYAADNDVSPMGPFQR